MTAPAVSSADASPNCATSLQALVDAAPAGTTLQAPACIFRETISITKPMTLVGQPGSEIRGSDVWTNWTQSGSTWHSGERVPAFSTHGQCATSDNRCLRAEQVFLDGARLTPNLLGNPSSGQFALDADRRVLLGDKPAGHTVEVTTRRGWIDPQADGVTIQGLTMKHAASDAQAGALSTGARSNWTIQDNVLSEAHGAVVSLGDGNNMRLLRNDIARGGQLGVAGGRGSGNLIQGNTIHDNNIDGFNPAWEGGGLKSALTADSTWDDNEVYDNIGSGLWCDINCQGITISNNRSHHNSQGSGIMFEISVGARIFGNSAWNNGAGLGWGWGAGILIAGSANTEVYNNVVAWNQSGISLISQQRSDLPAMGVVNNFVHDNMIVMGGAPDSLSLSWLQDWNGNTFAPSSNNRGDSNTYWYPTPENGFTRFGWNGPLSHLSDLNVTPGGTGSYISDVEEQQVLSARGMVLTP